MVRQFEAEDFLEHAEAADLIESSGGLAFLYTNDNGNIAIDKSVLAEFRKLTEGHAVWMKSAKAWRARDPRTDPKGVREQPL